VVDKMLHSFQAGLPGCSFADHERIHDAHVAEFPHRSNHSPLSQHTQDLLPFNTIQSPGFLTKKDIKCAGGIPDADTLSNAFTGKPNNAPPDHVVNHTCLAMEHDLTPPGSPLPIAQEFVDVDSTAGFTDHLSFARNGYEWQPTMNIMQNIKHDPHGHIRIEVDHGHRALSASAHAFGGRLTDDSNFVLGLSPHRGREW